MKRPPTESIRVRRMTARALRKVAYNPPFSCSSIAEFLRLVELGNIEALRSWQRQVSEYLNEDTQ